MKKLAVAIVVITSLLYDITDNTTYGIWAIIFTVLAVGYELSEKIDSMEESK